MPDYDRWKLTPPLDRTCEQCDHAQHEPGRCLLCQCAGAPCCDAGDAGHPGPHWHEE